MKGLVVILSIVLAVVATTFTGCITVVAPEGHAQPVSPPEVSEPEVSPPPYTEMQFSVTYPEIYRINVFAEEGAIVDGQWKSDEMVWTWYTSPNGCAYSLSAKSEFGGRLISIMQPAGDIRMPTYDQDGRRVAIYSCIGDTLSYIETRSPHGSTGYYTLCFMPVSYLGKEITANIIVRYRVR